MPASGAADAAALVSAISRLAWPLAVVVLAVTFRRPIAEQVARVRAVRAGNTEVTFAERVDDALRASAKLQAQAVDAVLAARQSSSSSARLN